MSLFSCGRGWLASLLAASALVLLSLTPGAVAQSVVPTFPYSVNGHAFTLLGNEPNQGRTTTIPVILVPLRLTFAGGQSASGGRYVLDAAADVARIEASPIFTAFAFPSGGRTQYLDALLRSTVPEARNWHTLLGHPQVQPVEISIPASEGYVLSSKRNGGMIAVTDIKFLQKATFQQIGKHPGALVIVVAPNASFYGGATGCCVFGTHGVDSTTGNTFVLASYLNHPPSLITNLDVQPITTQLAELANDPHANPDQTGFRGPNPGNKVQGWKIPGQAGGCGRGLWAQPTNTSVHDDFPASAAFSAVTDGTTFHLDNVALIGWYAQAKSGQFSFPAADALREPAQPCRMFRFGGPNAAPPPAPTTAALPESGGAHGHALIGYWIAYSSARATFPLREVAPQWDVIIVAFAQPDHKAPEGSFHFAPPTGMSVAQLKSDVAYLQHQGKKVMISLGGGGQMESFNSPASVAAFEHSVGQIVADYDFNGVDIDFEAPAMELQPGDTDFRHPTTPAVVHLLTGLRELHQRFGPKFMISLVPEGPQIPGGFPTYGGQYGSYLPLVYGLGNDLTFVDVQNYNTFPDEGLDGNIYQVGRGNRDYYTSMTELLLHGFDVGGNPTLHFPAIPANKVAIGFINGQPVGQIRQALSYLATGQKPAEARYILQNAGGYPGLLGAMLWTINGDRRGNYDFSNVIGPELHRLPAAATH